MTDAEYIRMRLAEGPGDGERQGPGAGAPRPPDGQTAAGSPGLSGSGLRRAQSRGGAGEGQPDPGADPRQPGTDETRRLLSTRNCPPPLKRGAENEGTEVTEMIQNALDMEYLRERRER